MAKPTTRHCSKTNAFLVVLLLLGALEGSSAFLGGGARVYLGKLPSVCKSTPSCSFRTGIREPMIGPHKTAPVVQQRRQQQQRQQQQQQQRHPPIKLGAFTTLPEPIPALTKSLFSYAGRVPLLQSFGLNAFLFAVLRPKLLKLLTREGFVHALALGTGLWTTLGWRGWTTCVLYLFLGSAVTRVKFREKQARGIAEGRGGKRGPENVWGSAATGLVCAICASVAASSTSTTATTMAMTTAATATNTFLGIPSELYLLGYVASLATKLSDTFASEIGKAYGKTTFLITTFERAEPGTEGAVSAEGTLASLVGGTLLTLYGWGVVGLISARAIPISIGAAFVATNIESVLGATLQGKPNLGWMTNEVVNFLNTLIGATIAIACGMVVL